VREKPRRVETLRNRKTMMTPSKTKGTEIDEGISSPTQATMPRCVETDIREKKKITEAHQEAWSAKKGQTRKLVPYRERKKEAGQELTSGPRVN